MSINAAPAPTSEAVMESDQDRISTITFVVVTPNRDFYIPRNAAEHRPRARNQARLDEQLRQIQWSVEETCKFASAEVVLSKI